MLGDALGEVGSWDTPLCATPLCLAGENEDEHDRRRERKECGSGARRRGAALPVVLARLGLSIACQTVTCALIADVGELAGLAEDIGAHICLREFESGVTDAQSGLNGFNALGFVNCGIGRVDLRAGRHHGAAAVRRHGGGLRA